MLRLLSLRLFVAALPEQLRARAGAGAWGGRGREVGHPGPAAASVARAAAREAAAASSCCCCGSLRPPLLLLVRQSVSQLLRQQHRLRREGGGCVAARVRGWASALTARNCARRCARSGSSASSSAWNSLCRAAAPASRRRAQEGGRVSCLRAPAVPAAVVAAAGCSARADSATRARARSPHSTALSSKHHKQNATPAGNGAARQLN